MQSKLEEVVTIKSKRFQAVFYSQTFYTLINIQKNYKAHRNHRLVSFFIGHFRYSADFELRCSWFPADFHCLMSSCMFSEVISRFWFLSLVQSNVILVWSYIQIFQTVFNNAAGDLSERTSQKQLMILCFWEEIHIDQSLWNKCISAHPLKMNDRVREIVMLKTVRWTKQDKIDYKV